jgi:carbon-monoxide dehydrogenase iron sulfur subunit
MKRKEIFIRYERCIGCHSCELACAVAHTSDGDLVGAILRGERPQKYLWVEDIDQKKVPTVCRQCEDAPCVAVCPTGAMYQRDDTINVCNLQQCIGCWMCALACPFGAIGRNEYEGKVVKCDRACLNEEGIPACVRACPTGALVFQTVEEFEAERRKEAVASLLK